MKQTKISYIFRVFILIFSVCPTVFELICLLMENAPAWLLSFPRPLVAARVLSWMFLSGNDIFAFLIISLLCLIPAIGTMFTRKNRILYMLTVALPFALSFIFLTFAMIFSSFSFSDYGLSWSVDILCLAVSIFIYILETKVAKNKL